MKPYHKNPRRLTEKQHTDLQSWLRELGDLSGIVHDLNSDEIIGGNMRGRVFDINACQIEIVHRQEQPDAQGTVANGFIVWEGNRYAYREVRWTPKQCEKANIVANKAGGDFDFDILANEFETPDLTDWGFSEEDLIGVDVVNPQLSESHEMLVPRKMIRVLISVPVEKAAEAKPLVDACLAVEGVEVLQGAN